METEVEKPSMSQLWREWWAVFCQQVKAHRITAFGFAAAALIVLILFVQSLTQILTGSAHVYVKYAFWGGMAGWAGTTLGALPGLALRRVPAIVEDTMLGFVAGMMLAATSFSLLLPGIEAGKEWADSLAGGAGLVVLGMALGVFVMLGLERFTPHEHEKAGQRGPAYDRLSRVWLFVFAIALHNLPEGMAIGVGFAQGDLSVGRPLTMAIALQDMPEGLAVALTLRAVGFSPWVAVAVASATGILEPLGALLGVGLAGGLAVAYPIGLGLAAGAMLFVVSHEVIPESHQNGHQTAATVGLLAGFAVMMFLDTVWS